MLPPLIHFMWLDKMDRARADYPDKYRTNVERAAALNPDWTVRVWTYRDIETEFPEYLDVLELFPVWISRCDFARFLVVQKYGGLYLDLDVVCTRPFDSYVTNRDILLIAEPEQHIHVFWALFGLGKIFNGIFGAAPQHPFVTGWLSRMEENVRSDPLVWDVMYYTGPVGLYQYYAAEWVDRVPVESCNTCLFMPLIRPVNINFNGDTFINPQCNDMGVEPFCFVDWNNGTGWVNTHVVSAVKVGLLVALIIALVWWYRKKK